MKSTLISKTLLGVAALLVTAVSAFSIPTPVNITISGGVDVTASADLSSYGDSTVFNWLKGDVTAYNTLHGSTLVAPTAGSGSAPLAKTDTESLKLSSITLNLNNNYDYIVLHWGGQGGGWVQAFNIAGLTGSFEFDAPPGGHPAVGGLSFYSFYGPTTPTTNSRVPDTTQTGFLFGAACAGLVAMRAFTRKGHSV